MELCKRDNERISESRLGRVLVSICIVGDEKKKSWAASQELVYTFQCYAAPFAPLPSTEAQVLDIRPRKRGLRDDHVISVPSHTQKEIPSLIARYQ